jgi:hypothetical protein
LDVCIRFAVFLICLLSMLFYKGNRRRLVSLIFISLIILPSAGYPLINTLAAHFMASQGTDYVGAYGVLTSALSQNTHILTVIASPLFFIAAGRYGVSQPDSEPFEI